MTSRLTRLTFPLHLRRPFAVLAATLNIPLPTQTTTTCASPAESRTGCTTDRMEKLLAECGESDTPYSDFWEKVTDEMLEELKPEEEEADATADEDLDLACHEEMESEEDELTFVCTMCGDTFTVDDMLYEDDVCAACRAKY